MASGRCLFCVRWFMHFHILMCSNRWYSAATEYGLRLFEYLRHRNDCDVRVLAHPGAPVLERAQHLGLATEEYPLRQYGGRAIGPWGALRLLFKMAALLESLSRREGSIVWCVEGAEHAALALLRLMKPRWRARVRLVRLRVQDFVRPSRGLGVLAERLQASATDLMVFPSEVARQRYFAKRPWAQAAYGNRVFVQLFCKDTGQPEARSHAALTNARGLQLMTRLSELHNPFVITTIARFDPVKGLEHLIQAFARMAQPPQELALQAEPCRALCLVICGRSEGLSAADLCRLSADALLGAAVVDLGHGVFAIRAGEGGGGSRREIIVVDGPLADIGQLLGKTDLAVISSLGSEIVCRTAVEYLQAALPVVATSVGSLPEVLGHAQASCPEPCGWLVPALDPNESPALFAARLGNALGQAAAFLSQTFDNAAVREMKERCRRRGARFQGAGFAPLVDRVTELPTGGR